jgi:hypothetical protein
VIGEEDLDSLIRLDRLLLWVSLMLKSALAVIGLIVAGFVLLHLTGHGLRHGM